jgi:hypothetical protein
MHAAAATATPCAPAPRVVLEAQLTENEEDDDGVHGALEEGRVHQ